MNIPIIIQVILFITYLYPLYITTREWISMRGSIGIYLHNTESNISAVSLLKLALCFVPIVNISILPDRGESFIKNFISHGNEVIVCKSCKMIQRRYQTNSFLLTKSYTTYHVYYTYENKCGYCYSNSVYRDTSLDDSKVEKFDIKMSPKLTMLSAFKLISKNFNITPISNEIKNKKLMEKIEKKKKDLEINDAQLENYKKLLEKQRNELEIKKEELLKNGEFIN